MHKQVERHPDSHTDRGDKVRHEEERVRGVPRRREEQVQYLNKTAYNLGKLETPRMGQTKTLNLSNSYNSIPSFPSQKY